MRSAHTPHGACEAMDTQGMPEKEVAALKRMKYSQLIREKIWQPWELCIRVSVCGQWGLQIVKKEGEQVTGNWLLHQGQQQSGEK